MFLPYKKRIKSLIYNLNCRLEIISIGPSLRQSQAFTTKRWLLMPKRKESFENIVEKGENAGNQHFLLFPQCFLTDDGQIY